jgi:antitoxin component HigA of HigAB toxin-antitoxin module
MPNTTRKAGNRIVRNGKVNDMTAYESLLLEYKPRPIRSAADHLRALKQIERLMKPNPGRAESELVEVLATLIEQYESTRFPTPRLSPAQRLGELLAAREISQASLSQETGIGTATISSVLAGRRGISKANAIKLAEFFGVSPGDFIAC